MAESIKRKLSKIKQNVLEAVDDGGSSQHRGSVQKKVTALLSASSKSVIGQWPRAFRRDEATKTSNNDLISRGERHKKHQTRCRFGESFFFLNIKLNVYARKSLVKFLRVFKNSLKVNPPSKIL